MEPYGVEIWDAFCRRLGEARETLRTAGAPNDPLNQAEGARYLSRIIRLGLEMYLEGGDPDFPMFVQPSHATAKLGGDNPDNLYLSATILGDRAYRISGNIGSVHYLSIGSKANRYAIDGTMASTGEIAKQDFRSDDNGNFEITVSAKKPEADVAWLPLEPDSNILQVRQTFRDRRKEAPAQMQIERISDGSLFPPPTQPEAISERLAAAADFVVNSTKLFAGWSTRFMQYPNEFREYDQEMFQRAGGDPAIFYQHAYWKLEPGQALVIETAVPTCEIWNIQVNNWWMESLDYRYVPACINDASAVLEVDGSVRIVLAPHNPGTKNWLSTHGHLEGFLLLRWVRADSYPVPRLSVVPID